VVRDDLCIDKYEYYVERFDPERADLGMQDRPRRNRKPRKTHKQLLAELTDDTADIVLGFETTYRPSRHEEGWLLSALYSFYDEGLITDVLALIKGGKEASVYLCEPHPAVGLGLLAAKVYRPRMFRNLRNDAMYRQGREVLTADGKPAGKQAGDYARAIRNKTAFGMQAAHTSWLMYEFTAMDRLYKAGAVVPRPISSSNNAILMGYHGDEQMAAPTLNTVNLERDEAELLFGEVVQNIELMLQHDLIHGDLSAYNILYWEGEITIIDFPQVVNLHSNPKARFILQRDIARTCEYFSGQGGCIAFGVVAGNGRRRGRRRLSREPGAAGCAVPGSSHEKSCRRATCLTKGLSRYPMRRPSPVSSSGTFVVRRIIRPCSPSSMGPRRATVSSGPIPWRT
jgi:RIO kinase 1